jgi:hypothetical protein
MAGWDCHIIVVVINIVVLLAFFIGEMGIFERGSIRRDCHVIIIISLWR